MNEVLFGIAGKAGSGKDTVARIINSKLKNSVFNNSAIIHYADNLKNILSLLYGIPIEAFYSHRKDEIFIDLRTNKIIDDNELGTYRELKVNGLYSLKPYIDSPIHWRISIRRLMQFFGTDVCRRYLGDDIWINSTINRAIRSIQDNGYCIIADVRFDNEAKAIKAIPYGVTIEVKRDTDISYKHPSENIDFECDYIINNDGTIEELETKVETLLEKIYAKS